MRNSGVSFFEHQKCVGILNFYLNSSIYHEQEQTPQPPVVGAPPVGASAVSNGQTPPPPVVGSPSVSNRQTPQSPVVGAPPVGAYAVSNGQTPPPPVVGGPLVGAPAEPSVQTLSTGEASDVVTSSNQNQAINPLINGNDSGNGIIVITTNDNIIAFLTQVIQQRM